MTDKMYKYSIPSLISLMVLIAFGIIIVRLTSLTGWDALNYRNYYFLWQQGYDPYSAETISRLLGSPFPSTYPPLVVAFLHPLISATRNMSLAACTLAFAISYLAFTKRTIFEAAFMAGAFGAFLECALSGNYAFVEFLFISAAFYYLIENTNFWAAGFFMALAVYLKLQPVLYLVIILAWLPAAHALKLAIRFLVVLSLLWSLTLLFYPVESLSYMRFVYQLWTGSSAVTGDVMLGATDALAIVAGMSLKTASVLIKVIAGATVAFLALRGRGNKVWLAWALIISPLLLPRLVPYSFVWALVPALTITDAFRERGKLIALISVTMPQLILFLHLRMFKEPLPYLPEPSAFWRYHYSTLCYVCSIFMLGIIHWLELGRPDLKAELRHALVQVNFSGN